MYVLTLYPDKSADIHPHEDGVCKHDQTIARWDDADASADDIARDWSLVGGIVIGQSPSGPVIQSEVIRNT